MSQKKKKDDFQFAVGSMFNRMSNIMRVCVRKNDIYIIPSTSNSDHKISFHESGICHSALTKEAAKKFNMSSMQRRNVEWLADVSESEIQTIFRIVFPHDHLKKQPESNLQYKNIQWLSIPDVNMAIVIEIVKIGKPRFPIQWKLATGKVLQIITVQNGDVYAFFVYQIAIGHSLENSINIAVNIAKTMKKRLVANITGGFITLENKDDGVMNYVHYII